MMDCEKNTINNLGLGSLVLMERAGLFAASACLELKPKRVLVLCGTGNNGADGIVVGRLLAKHDILVDLLVLGDRKKASCENIHQLDTFIKIYGSLNIKYSISQVDFSKYDLFVDGIFGINLNRPLTGDFLLAVNLVNEEAARHKAKVLSLDIPSGLNSTNGLIYNQCIKADITTSFGFLKLGHYLGQGRNFSGKILLDSVGIEGSTASALPRALEKEDVINYLKREPVSNKSTYGKALIIAGADGMPGAALMATYGALKSGLGMAYLVTGRDNMASILELVPEAMVGDMDAITNNDLSAKLDWCDVVLIGPGLGTSNRSKELVEYISVNAKVPVIYDADGLNILADNKEIIVSRAKMGGLSILTPHPMEFARVFGSDIRDKKHQDIDFITKEAIKYNAIIIAKDATSVITNGQQVYVNIYGNPGMSCGGSGDVLAGVVAAMCGRFSDYLYAAAIGTCIHSLAGDYAKDIYGVSYMTPMNIIESIKVILGGD